MFLTDFHILRPTYETSQEQTLEWLVEAHAQADGSDIRSELWRVGCKPDRIAKRGHVLSDFLHRNWEEMEIYVKGAGKSLGARAAIFGREADQAFAFYYPEGAVAPDDLIHVTCTGYVAPSGAQKIVSQRMWPTTVTHAYHMGCYGAIPAIRIGMGLFRGTLDIVHTEICSLHSNPALHALDQLVAQSLFADGFIKYSIAQTKAAPSFQIHKLYEQIIPNSTRAMTWNVAEWGFQMSLAKEIPVLIVRHLENYLKAFGDWSQALFAIHPGGPKILTHIQELLRLPDAALRHSFHVLKEYGNMSSATLPHIWNAMLQDEEVKPNTKVISLAFGPGLTIAGSLMEKVCGS